MTPDNPSSGPENAASHLLLVDDHAIVTEGLRNALAGHPEFEIVDTAADGEEALAKIRDLRPDIVLLDISMPNRNGIETVWQLKKTDPATTVLIYSMYADREHVIALFREGISGYVLKEDSLEELILALETVRAGGTYFSAAVNGHLQEHMRELERGDTQEAREIQNGIAVLSTREKEIFPLLADGLTVKEIAHTLCISPKTVESHKYNILEKLGAKSIAELTKLALKKDLIKL